MPSSLGKREFSRQALCERGHVGMRERGDARVREQKKYINFRCINFFFVYFLHIFHIFWDLKLIVDKRGAPEAPPTHYPINFRSPKI